MAARRCSTASRSRRRRTTTITSRPWLTTWSDGVVRHHALAERIQDDDGRWDPYLINVVTPCHGYVADALDNTSEKTGPSCLFCVASQFADNVRAMNMDAIEHLGEEDLVAHFVDHDAMSLVYEHDT